MLFLQIRKFTQKRSQTLRNNNLKKEIRAARMFFPVVVLLFICNTVTYLNLFVYYTRKVLYREMIFTSALSTTFNATINLVIYYAKGSSLREEMRRSNYLPSWMKFVLGKMTCSSSSPGVMKSCCSCCCPSEDASIEGDNDQSEYYGTDATGSNKIVGDGTPVTATSTI